MRVGAARCVRRRVRREALGQIVRNTGRAAVGLRQTTPTPPDLAVLLDLTAVRPARGYSGLRASTRNTTPPRPVRLA
ncbi:MAG: hypothetical protein EKK60_08185 [Gordonia sp. (in: high G+C Gram-positive bacteria)]|nr:MAG: hypothetical protein EKK60_08185 [Gordonia sp. (in: high G+C Gram-positive bacteria)]